MPDISGIVQIINIAGNGGGKNRPQLFAMFGKVSVLQKIGDAITISALRRFELIYDSIYGSQLRLLQDINAAGVRDLGIFEHYYNQGKTQAPVEYDNITLTNYSQFLYSWALVVNDQSNGVQITTLGIDFLKYIIDARKNIYLPL